MDSKDQNLKSQERRYRETCFLSKKKRGLFNRLYFHGMDHFATGSELPMIRGAQADAGCNSEWEVEVRSRTFEISFNL